MRAPVLRRVRLLTAFLARGEEQEALVLARALVRALEPRRRRREPAVEQLRLRLPVRNDTDPHRNDADPRWNESVRAPASDVHESPGRVASV